MNVIDYLHNWLRLVVKESKEIIMEKANEFSLPVPWGHIAAKAWGNPTNFPVLCVHGILDNAGAFDRLIAQLPKSYYYVSIDLPGHGFSSHFPAGVPLDFFNYILSIRYVAERLKWKTFKYIGHSLGSQLGAWYSIIYPDQIQSLVLIEGIIDKPFRNKDIIPRLRTIMNSSVEAYNETKYNLYSYDDIIYFLKCRRQSCLNTEAAEAIFKRSVTLEGEFFKYNRDVRLKIYCPPILSMDQWVTVFSNLNVKILLIYTNASIDGLTKRDPRSIETLANLLESFSNIEFLNVLGNHDVHNNNPERMSHEISKFLDKPYATSKL